MNNTTSTPDESMSTLAQQWRNMAAYTGTAAAMMQTWHEKSAPFMAFLDSCGFHFPDFDHNNPIPPAPLFPLDRESNEVRFGKTDFQVVDTLDVGFGLRCVRLTQTGYGDQTLDPYEAPSVYLSINQKGEFMTETGGWSDSKTALIEFFQGLRTMAPEAFTEMSKHTALLQPYFGTDDVQRLISDRVMPTPTDSLEPGRK